MLVATFIQVVTLLKKHNMNARAHVKRRCGPATRSDRLSSAFAERHHVPALPYTLGFAYTDTGDYVYILEDWYRSD